MAFLGSRTEDSDKHMNRLPHGRLTKEQLAKALFRSAFFTKDMVAWKMIVDWLRRNGYEKYVRQIIAKKALM